MKTFLSTVSSPGMRTQRGLTLVELMVAMVLGLLMTGVIISVFLANRQIYRAQDDNARLQESGRFALSFIGRHLREAGYPDRTLPVVDRRGPRFVGAAIDGVNGASGAADSITVRTEAAADCLGESTTAAGGVATNVFSLDAANRRLRCTGNSGTATELISDVEDLQASYGLDTNNDQAVDRYKDIPANATEWGQVMTVRLCVLVRSQNDAVTTQAQTYANCQDAAVTATDRRLRRTFTETINLRNRVLDMP